MKKHIDFFTTLIQSLRDCSTVRISAIQTTGLELALGFYLKTKSSTQRLHHAGRVRSWIRSSGWLTPLNSFKQFSLRTAQSPYRWAICITRPCAATESRSSSPAARKRALPSCPELWAQTAWGNTILPSPEHPYQHLLQKKLICSYFFVINAKLNICEVINVEEKCLILDCTWSCRNTIQTRFPFKEFSSDS